jgi:hypothetical protein
MKKIAGVLFVLAASVALFAGPFGIEMGWSKDDCIKAGITLTETSHAGDVVSYSCTPPKVHPDFTFYAIRIDSQKGVYDIFATTDSIRTSDYGIEIQDKFNELADQLSSVYGQPEKYDFLMSGSIWKEPNDWMMGLYKKERTFADTWSIKKNNIDGAMLEAVALSSSSAIIKIWYQSPEAGEIISRIKKSTAAVF